jgi:hypothetical protein
MPRLYSAAADEHRAQLQVEECVCVSRTQLAEASVAVPLAAAVAWTGVDAAIPGRMSPANATAGMLTQPPPMTIAPTSADVDGFMLLLPSAKP